MKKAYRYLWFLSLIVVVVLSACGKNGNETSNTSNKTGKSDAKGGTLTVGIAEPPEGNF